MDTAHLVFGSGYLVLGLVLVGVFVNVYRGYARKWAEVPPTARRRGQVNRASLAGVGLAAVMCALGGAIIAGGPLGLFGWLGLVVAALAYALLYPLSDERRFIDGPIRER